ncbi:MAG: DUF58 domain-containing protein [Ardenticatenaceae bacterium]|nr:DUF58 domain-containing protein [Ardenticatenaceae bacterium]
MPSRIRFQIKSKPLLWIFAAAVLGANLLPNAAWDTILIALGLLILTCGIWTWLLSRFIQSERKLTREWLAVGDRLIEQIAIHNVAWIPATWLEFTDESNIPGYRSHVVYELPGEFSLHWRQNAACHQRGRYQLGPWQLKTGDPFGLFEVILNFDQVNEIVIYPPTDAVILLDMVFGQLEGQKIAQKKALQLTENVATLRDYHPGDPLKWVHWPTTARRGSLAVREFERNISGDVWIVLDGYLRAQLGEGQDATAEAAVLMAAAMAANLAERNRSLGLMAYGREVQIVSPVETIQQWRVLYELAIFEPKGDVPVSQGLIHSVKTFKQGSSVVVITPDEDPALLESLLYLTSKKILATVIMLDRQSFGSSAPPENLSLRQEIQRMGHRAFIVRSDEIMSPTYEEGKKEKFVTTPLGRVMEVDRG